MVILQILVLGIPLLAWYLYTRLQYNRLVKYKDFPQLKPDLFWGHLKTVNEYMNDPSRPKNTDSDYAFADMIKKAGNPDVLLVDLRPAMWPVLIVGTHSVAEQVSRPSKTFKYSFPKSPTVLDIADVIGKKSMIAMQGEEWKALRKRFNPGFAPAHLITLLPEVIAQTRTFHQRLEERARSGEVFSLETLCTNLTFDIIGQVTMGVQLHAQDNESEWHPIVKPLKDLLKVSGYSGIFDRVNPVVQYRRRQSGKTFNRTLTAAVAAKIQDARAQEQSDPGNTKTLASRSVLALAVQGIDTITPDILSLATDQIKSFVFAGHDTTSILLQWAYYELSRHPACLATLTAELDSVLGPSTDPAEISATLLERGDEVFSKLSYTSAVIKETLRLYPPAGTARFSQPGQNGILTLSDGRSLNTDGQVVYLCHYLIQRDEAVYGPNATDWVPERWLGNTDTSTAVSSGEGETGAGAGAGAFPPASWRPFERGPRNCIGQELANMEVRVILATTVRRYKFTKVGTGEAVVGEKGEVVLDGKGRVVCGSELFNKRQITSSPIDGMQMRVAINA